MELGSYNPKRIRISHQLFDSMIRYVVSDCNCSQATSCQHLAPTPTLRRSTSSAEICHPEAPRNDTNSTVQVPARVNLRQLLGSKLGILYGSQRVGVTSLTLLNGWGGLRYCRALASPDSALQDLVRLGRYIDTPVCPK